MFSPWRVKSLDDVFGALLNFYKKTNIKTIAFAQSGDFVGGKENNWAKKIKMKRKAMNTFLASTTHQQA